MLTKEKILAAVKKNQQITTKDIVKIFKVSRQYANSMIAALVAEHKLTKVGATKNSFYVLPGHALIYVFRYTKSFKNHNLEEHKILDDIEHHSPTLGELAENIHSIFTYAFSEMFNNAIEHSQSETIKVEVTVDIKKQILLFIIDDNGVGVFRNIMRKKSLQSELEAIQELLKGKTTTMPRSHSGEGIFFTSRVADHFVLDSYGYRLIFDNGLPDIFIEQVKKIKKGTRVNFSINLASNRHLNDIFNKYANIDEESDYGFDKTEILVKLYTVGGVYVSRSQARRILSGLEKFRVILFDYDKVPMVGQAYADEIYRVFQHKYPQIKIEEINMNDTVKFMVTRAKTEAKKAMMNGTGLPVPDN